MEEQGLIKTSEGSHITDSEILGEIFLDRYACVTRSRLQGYNAIGCFSYVRNTILGRYTHIGARASIGGAKHPLDWVSSGSFQYRNDCWECKSKVIPFDEGQGPSIGSDVWIADNSVVLGSLSIGTGSIVGAGSVVVKDVHPYTIVCGNPAQMIRRRFNNALSDQLYESQWWEKSPKELEGLTMNDPRRFLLEYRERFA
jgi:acetyltransferase-like isoleucine patch superfamily enzyme